jgi:hypothetical protein
LSNDAEPGERVCSLRTLKNGSGAIGDTQTAVTARHVVTLQAHALAVSFVHDGRAGAGETIDLNHLGVKLELSARRNAQSDQVLHQFLLAIDRNGASFGEVTQGDPMALAVEPHLHAMMDQTFTRHALTGARFPQHLHDPVLNDPRAHPCLDVRSTSTLDDDIVDAVAREKVSKKESGRSRAHDNDPGFSTHDHDTPPSAEVNPVPLINFLVYPREY